MYSYRDLFKTLNQILKVNCGKYTNINQKYKLIPEKELGVVIYRNAPVIFRCPICVRKLNIVL